MTMDDTLEGLRTWYGHDPCMPDLDPGRAGSRLTGGPLDGE
ncbi:hypothetical protein ACIBSV_37435 [Embleya sp. NPDC050154]